MIGIGFTSQLSFAAASRTALLRRVLSSVLSVAVLAVLTSGCVANTASTDADADRSEQVDALFSRFTDGVQPGVAVMVIRDGEVVTACQQACPSNAISFGNVKERSSVTAALVKQGEEQNRAYHALQELNTRSAVTYLAQVRRAKNEGVL